MVVGFLYLCVTFFILILFYFSLIHPLLFVSLGRGVEKAAPIPEAVVFSFLRSFFPLFFFRLTPEGPTDPIASRGPYQKQA